MTGFNHYSDCTCGWCVNYGRSRIDQGQVRAGLRQRDALTLLKRHSANSIWGCYVNPNARCPVCSSPVFFYANRFGSRVYFDDLGPPWPKHPCTDNPRRRIEFHAKPDGAPTRRPRGLMQELIRAADVAGCFRGKIVGNRTSKEWTLLVIVFVERRGEENTVTAEFLDSQERETIEFKCFSSAPVFQVGDFVSKKGNEISFFYPETLAPITLRLGSTVQLNPPAPVSLPPKKPESGALTQEELVIRLSKLGRVVVKGGNSG